MKWIRTNWTIISGIGGLVLAGVIAFVRLQNSAYVLGIGVKQNAHDIDAACKRIRVVENNHSDLNARVVNIEAMVTEQRGDIKEVLKRLPQ